MALLQLGPPAANEDDVNQTELLDLDMPDQCLFDILCYLDIPTLTSIAATCTRLQNIARDVFKRHAESKRLDVLKLVISFEPITMDKLEKFFKIFGDLIDEILLDFTDRAYRKILLYQDMDIPIFKLITAHCGGGNLRTLLLHKIPFDVNSSNSPESPDTLRLFSRLEKIVLVGCDDISKLLSVSKQCVFLSISRPRNLHLNFIFPKLETFCYEGYNESRGNNFHVEFQQFLERHENLVTLDVILPHGIRIIDLNVIGRLKFLQDLRFSSADYYHSFSGLEFLPMLKKLDLGHADHVAIRNLLKESASAESIEYLGISGNIDDDFINAVHRFCNLRTLEFYLCAGRDSTGDGWNRLRFEKLTKLILLNTNDRNITKDGITNFIKNNRKLQTIILADTWLSIDRDTYVKIAKICEQQNRVLIMKWSSCDYEGFCDEENMADPRPPTVAEDINFDSHFLIEKIERAHYFAKNTALWLDGY